MINIYDFISSNSTYFDQLEFDENKSLFIDYVCPIEENLARVWTHKNCLMYVVKGRKGYTSLNHYHESREHQILFIRKGGIILHQFFQEPYRALIFMFDDLAIKELLMEFPALLTAKIQKSDFNNTPAITELKSNHFVKSAFISSMEYLQKPSVESSIALRIKFKEIFVNILRDKTDLTFASFLSWICNDADAAFIKLMKENSHYNFTTQELARIAGMSHSTLKREFLRIFGINPGKWLREQRISRALYLLSNTKTTISEIAFELGYNDAAAFSKAFKSANGKNPSDFRKTGNSELK